MRTLHLTARYESRHQDIEQSTFKKDSYRVSFGVAFSSRRYSSVHLVDLNPGFREILIQGCLLPPTPDCG